MTPLLMSSGVERLTFLASMAVLMRWSYRHKFWVL